ncbi:MAG: ABC transporter permease [Clostridiales Family XIII bacterium]|jgi:putative ABC transport system permease protein|nr:ABC transporter permease [Clostridiales Family XIII bacterium]
MNLTSHLAYCQIKNSRARTIWTLLGIALSSAMTTAIFGFVWSADAAFTSAIGDNYYNRGIYLMDMIGISTILCAIIVTASVIAVSNAFRISAAERTEQFGILKSVGATKKQIALTVLYEGMMLSAVGIPVGIAAGLVLEFAGTSIANYFLHAFNSLNTVVFEFRFVLAWQAILVSAFVAFVTVVLSAWLPARKAARIPAIDAIRSSGEVSLEATSQLRSEATSHPKRPKRPKRQRTNPLVQKLFGFEGTLAAKSLKRSRRNFRATVISLTISIVLILSTNSLGTQINQMSDLLFPTTDATVVAQYSSAVSYTTYGTEEDGDLITKREYTTIDAATAEKVTSALRDYDDSPVFGVGSDSHTYTVKLPEEMFTKEMRALMDSGGDDPEAAPADFGIALFTTDAAHYAALCEKAHVPLGSNILINDYRTEEAGKKMELTPFVFSRQTLHLESMDTPNLDLPLHGELTVGEVPNEVMYQTGAVIAVLVPDGSAVFYDWCVDTSDPAGFTEYANKILPELIPQSELPNVYVEATNVQDATAAIRAVSRLIMVFVYGFVAMLTLIGLTNVICTISTNVRSRAREFAVLKSVGMTHKGLRRMLNLESILCSAKALLYGLPIGLALTLLIHRFVMHSVGVGYHFPWLAALECIAGVFAITWITMRYAAGRLKDKNIVEAIRA